MVGESFFAIRATLEPFGISGQTPKTTDRYRTRLYHTYVPSALTFPSRLLP